MSTASEHAAALARLREQLRADEEAEKAEAKAKRADYLGIPVTFED